MFRLHGVMILLLVVVILSAFVDIVSLLLVAWLDHACGVGGAHLGELRVR